MQQTIPVKILSVQWQQKHSLNRLCAEAVQQQISSGKVANDQRRNRRRHLFKHLLKRLPHRAPFSKVLKIATLVLASWGFAGLAMTQAHAATPSFTVANGTTVINPLSSVNAGISSAVEPSFADLDGDGDLDAFIGLKLGTIKYYQNIGTNIAPNFTAVTGVNNPFYGIDVGGYAAPSFADLDDDGDLDAFIGNSLGNIKFYQNIGTSIAPNFSAVVGVNNPFYGIDVGRNAIPAFVDIDGDGDLDAFIGKYNYTVQFYQNIGTLSAPNFSAVSGGANPLNGVYISNYSSAPRFADLDGDGDFDVFIGAGDGTVYYYQNTGTNTVPSFGAVSGVNNPLNGFDVGFNAVPSFADLDGDGDLDAFIGEYNGALKYYQNDSATAALFIGTVGSLATGTVDDSAYNVILTAGGGAAPYTWSIASGSLPNGLVLTPSTGVISGSPTTAGSSNFTVQVTDSVSTTITQPLSIVIDKANQTIGFTPDLRVILGTLVNLSATTTSGLAPSYGTSTTGVCTVSGGTVSYNHLGVCTLVASQAGNSDYNAATQVTVDIAVSLAPASFVTRPAPSFTAANGSTVINPFNGVDLGDHAAPVLVDLDGDGDLDAFIGEATGSVQYYRNTGTSNAPIFTSVTGVNNPLNGVAVYSYAKPSFADLDGDGDLDAFIGEYYGTVKFYQNIGTSTAPVFSAVMGSSNPFYGIDVGDYAAPSFADLDGDGDLDAFIGGYTGTIRSFHNAGSSTVPSFIEVIGASSFIDNKIVPNPFFGKDVGGYATPSFADLDGDGDLDAIIGAEFDEVKYYKNTGTPLVPVLIPYAGMDNPFYGLNVDFNSAPSFADLDGDGDLDAIIGKWGGSVTFYQNDTPSFTVNNPLSGVNVGGYAKPSFADLDGDGDLDFFVGNVNGTVNFYKNTGSSSAPFFTAYTGLNNPLNGFDVGALAAISFADLDGDGDLDVFIGCSSCSYSRAMMYFQNTGTSTVPSFTAFTAFGGPLGNISHGFNTTPSFVDLDDDGDLDVFIGNGYGIIKFYRNYGTGSAPAFSPVASFNTNNPLDGFDIGNNATPSFADLDRDGDLDAFIGNSYGVIKFYENTGTKSAPVFTSVKGFFDPLNDIDVGAQAAPSFADLDGDGDLDSFVGRWDGTVKYYENDSAPPNVSVGAGSSVNLAPVVLTFENVIVAGIASATVATSSGLSSTGLGGLKFGNNGRVYDVVPGAKFLAGVEVCVTYDPTQFPSENGLRLIHLVHSSNAWEDITTSLSQTTDTICGRTTSFSHFAVVHPGATFVSLAAFDAFVNSVNEVLLHWATDIEVDQYGFELIREDKTTGERVVIDRQIGLNFNGADYQFVDTTAVVNNDYAYTLVDIDTHGKRTEHGLLNITVTSGQNFTFDPESGVTAVIVNHVESATGNGGALSLWGLLILGFMGILARRRRC